MLPPFRQYKGKYFFYFLVLSVSDIINFTFLITLGINPLDIHIIFSLLLLISIQPKEYLVRYIYLFLLLFVLGLSLIFYLPNYNDILFIVLIHSFILFLFIKDAVLYTNIYKEINIFSFILILYESTIIMKFIILLSGLKTSVEYFYITSAFEIIIALFFTVFRKETSPKILLIK